MLSLYSFKLFCYFNKRSFFLRNKMRLFNNLFVLICYFKSLILTLFKVILTHLLQALNILFIVLYYFIHSFSSIKKTELVFIYEYQKSNTPISQMSWLSQFCCSFPLSTPLVLRFSYSMIIKFPSTSSHYPPKP